MKFEPTKYPSTNVFGHGIHISRWGLGCLHGGTKKSNSLDVRTKLATSFKNFPSLLGFGVNHMLI
jgi:hypothetical protein